MTLTEFFRSGRLGPVHRGASATDLIARFGVPDHRSGPRPVVLEWGSLSLTLDPANDDEVQSIRVRTIEGTFRLPAGLLVQWDPLATMRSREHVDWHLERQGIPFHKDFAIDLTTYTSDAGVVLCFGRDGRDQSFDPESLVELRAGSDPLGE